MLSLLAASGAAEPIYWENLGLRPYLFEIGGFQLRFYSLAYLLGILLGYWHLSKMIKAPGAPRVWSARAMRPKTNARVAEATGDI